MAGGEHQPFGFGGDQLVFVQGDIEICQIDYGADQTTRGTEYNLVSLVHSIGSGKIIQDMGVCRLTDHVDRNAVIHPWGGRMLSIIKDGKDRPEARLITLCNFPYRSPL